MSVSGCIAEMIQKIAEMIQETAAIAEAILAQIDEDQIFGQFIWPRR